MNTKLLDTVTNSYLSSHDFNGITVSHLASEVSQEVDELKSQLAELIQAKKINIVFPDTDVNPHILRIGVEPKQVQISKLRKLNKDNGFKFACVYPHKEHLKTVVDLRVYEDRPYLGELALGNPQLDFRPFDLSVLEFYRNEPRYSYKNDDIHGSIYYKDKVDLRESDQIFLQTFGFCYNEAMNRAVAVFIRYLADLTPEHQGIWRSKELSGKFKIHPDYYKNTIEGTWGDGISLFDALLLEMRLINKMADKMGRPNLLRNDFENGNKPHELSFLIRPTLKEYNDFVLVLDKMFSENLNKEFFAGQIPTTEETLRDDGKIEVREVGTIRLLQEWINRFFKPHDPQPLEEMLLAFKKIRTLRQKPAHSLQENEFDQKYFSMQRELAIEAYSAMRNLRLLLQNHPATKAIVPDEILNETIWTY